MKPADYHAQEKYKPLTKADLAALAWAVRRAANNTCVILGGLTNAVYTANKAEYDGKVKAARRAMRKVRELQGQGL